MSAPRASLLHQSRHIKSHPSFVRQALQFGRPELGPSLVVMAFSSGGEWRTLLDRPLYGPVVRAPSASSDGWWQNEPCALQPQERVVAGVAAGAVAAAAPVLVACDGTSSTAAEAGGTSVADSAANSVADESSVALALHLLRELEEKPAPFFIELFTALVDGSGKERTLALLKDALAVHAAHAVEEPADDMADVVRVQDGSRRRSKGGVFLQLVQVRLSFWCCAAFCHTTSRRRRCVLLRSRCLSLHCVSVHSLVVIEGFGQGTVLGAEEGSEEGCEDAEDSG